MNSPQPYRTYLQTRSEDARDSCLRNNRSNLCLELADLALLQVVVVFSKIQYIETVDDFLQILIEQIESQGDIWSVHDLAQVLGVSSQIPDDVPLLGHKLLLQMMRHFRIVMISLMSRGSLMDIKGFLSQLLFDIQSFSQRVKLVQLQSGCIVAHIVYCVNVAEAHFSSTRCYVLDGVDGVLPQAIRKASEQFLESGPILQVVSIVGGQNEKIERFVQKTVGESLQFAFNGIDRSIFRVTSTQ
ncbi:hypothetical protein D910_10119 [Dendroctonus ponderosae]|uniref:Uncharacterized protein n=1 Tax=Dendroctonus ponderosae TaxID=77166 RepID=U4URN3_DENPD|nr:hypothetical protein D910_10119 [Dendroctonus ponderosae]